jgi:hypothetical protein
MATETKKFPKFVHITREDEGTEEEALTDRTTTRVATYELKEIKEGKLQPVFDVIIGE